MSAVIVAIAGFAAGFMNVLAGGGSFLTLPALIAAGMTALGANASSTVALFPAQAITAVMARADLADGLDIQGETPTLSFKVLASISLVGGFFGALLLLLTPPNVFLKIVPWLILFATSVFARGPAIRRQADGARMGTRSAYAIQGLVSVYSGYFGGGIGILMLAALTVFGLRDIRVMNSIKIVLAMLMNVAAVATFVMAGLVHWPLTSILGITAIVGSLVGMAAARRIASDHVRWFVIVIGIALTIGFFWRDVRTNIAEAATNIRSIY